MLVGHTVRASNIKHMSGAVCCCEIREWSHLLEGAGLGFLDLARRRVAKPALSHARSGQRQRRRTSPTLDASNALASAYQKRPRHTGPHR